MIRWMLIIGLLVSLVFRVWDLGNVPNGFSWDEMDNTYQAYSLLKTGRDIFGNPLPVLLHAFADYKSSLYIYMTVPFVALAGMTIITSKMAAAIFGVLSIFCVGIVSARLLKSIDWGIVAAICMAFSPWWFTYSRLSFEADGMLSLFLIGVALLPKRPLLSTIMFSLSVWAYSTAKLFVPLFLIITVLNYWHEIRLKKAIVMAGLFTLLILPVLWQTFFGRGGTRFNEISIFTDPTTNSEVNFALEEGQVASGVEKTVGLQPRPVDRLAHNKFAYWLNRLAANYLSAFSTDFLFAKGDPNLRHSPGKNSVGQLHVTDVIFVVLGLTWLFKKQQRWIAVWLILAPFASIITRDGGSHATRLLYMLPPLIFIATAGLRNLNKLARLPLIAIHLYFIFSFSYFYFSHYRFESLKPFHWGFDKAVSQAVSLASRYQNVIIDYKNDSALMAYLVATQYDPAKLQSQHPLPQKEVVPGYSGNVFDNVIILPPGSRPWKDFAMAENTLLVLSADQETPKEPFDTINYPDGTKAFNFISY